MGSHFSQLCLKAKQILLGWAQRNVYSRCSILKGKLLQGICRIPRRGTAGGQISQNRPFVQSCSIHFSFSYFFFILKLRRHSQQGGRSCAGARGGPRQRVWTLTKILSPNICYFVAILRFVVIYALFGKL